MSQLYVYLIVAEKKRGKNQQILVNVREKQMHESLNEGCASNPQELWGGEQMTVHDKVTYCPGHRNVDRVQIDDCK